LTAVEWPSGSDADLPWGCPILVRSEPSSRRTGGLDDLSQVQLLRSNAAVQAARSTAVKIAVSLSSFRALPRRRTSLHPAAPAQCAPAGREGLDYRSETALSAIFGVGLERGTGGREILLCRRMRKTRRQGLAEGLLHEDGHPRQAHCTSFTKWLCRTADRIDPVARRSRASRMHSTQRSVTGGRREAVRVIT
jgi:hypothetical protein